MVKKYYSVVSKSNMGRLMAGLIILVTVIAKPFPLFTVNVVKAATITYTYDNLNRLETVNYGNEATITYTYDPAGNRTSLTSTPPTPPTTPVVTDDGDYTLNLTQLCAIWISDDPESSVAEYQYAIGTAPQGTDVSDWTSTGTTNSICHALPLSDVIAYYISVKARNGFSLWSNVGSSNGIVALLPNSDADGDGLTNTEEINTYGTNPLVADTDGDGMPDGWEVLYSLNPLDSADAATDPDGDDFTNLQEYQKGTDPIDSLSHPPMANAGRDQNVKTGSTVTLDGSASSGQDGNMITFDWTQTYRPPDSGATLSDATTPKTRFTADKDGYYSYDLTACDYNDPNNCSGPDSVTVYATLPNVPPNANSGPDQDILTGLSVLLDGSASNDPDSSQGPLSYLWSFVSQPTGSLLTELNIAGIDTPLASFVPDVDGEYGLNLAVSDGSDTTNDQVVIMASGATPPVADAGTDRIVKIGQGVILDGAGSYDQDGLPQPLTYQWSFVSIPAGSALTNAGISNANINSAGFTPDVAGSYVLQLAASDGQYTATDNVVVIADGGAPTGSILINGGAIWTNTLSIALTLSCSDTESICSQMRLSNDKITWSPWEAYNTSKAWTLSTGSGTKKVYVRYKDGAGYVSPTFSDGITLDTTKPVLSGVSDTPDPFRPSLGEVSTISFTASDNLSGTCTIRARIYNASNTLVRTVTKTGVSCPAGGAAGSITWNGKDTGGVLVPAGPYTYKLQARDKAMNWSVVRSGTVAVE